MPKMAPNMSALMDLVAQNQPRFKTHQALLVIGLQNDFIQPDGRLPVSTKSGYLERIQTLIPKFRELNGNVIWVQTLYEADRIANDANTGEGDALVVGGLIDGDESSTEGGDEELPKDLPTEKSRSSKHKQRALDLLKRVSARRKAIPQEVARATAEQDDELFLLQSEIKSPACVPNTPGAEFADIIARQFELPADIVIRTTNYSAFQGTSLLMTLRARLVTELYICGCITNVSVLATVIDAARHGVKINVIEDCLGYRKQARHDLALKRMDEFFDAYLVNSTEILAREPPEPPQKQPTSPSGSRKESRGSDKGLENMVGKLTLNDPEGRTPSRPQSIRSPTKILTGGQRKLSLVSAVESRKALSPPLDIDPTPEPTDEQFADNLVQGAVVPGAQDRGQDRERAETKLVTKKIRMRSKGRKKKKKEEGEDTKEQTEPAAADSGASPAVTPAEEAKPVVTPTPEVVAPTPEPPAQPLPEPQRTVQVAKAESTLNLREKISRQQSLKSVASQPVLSPKSEMKEKEKDRDSWSERMRLSFSRAPKSESASESKKRLSIVSTKAPPTPSRAESRPVSATARSFEAPATPVKIESAASKEPSTPASRKEFEAPIPTTPTVAVQAPTPPTMIPGSSSKEITTSDGSASNEAEQPVVVAHSKPLTPKPHSVTMSKPSKLQSLANLPVLGPGDSIAEGDSRIVYDFFPSAFKHPSDITEPLHNLIFSQLQKEVQWQKMLHQQGEVPRLVCCQGEFGDDGSMPIYRHPSDQTLPLLHFSPKVQLIKKQAEKIAGHPLNHVLIQMYRSGNDYISEHSDKTLDIVKGSSIVNVSFGAQRTMRLRTKKASKGNDTKETENNTEPSPNDPRTTQRIAMPHNSIFILGLESNKKWLHGIMPDKRVSNERSDPETAYAGIRISLTFRHIGTFLDAKESTIWGQGATAKEQRDAADVINGDEEENERLIRAFSRENHNPDFDWVEWYADGFDVLHLSHAPEDNALLFASSSPVQNAQVQLALAEAKVKFTLVPAAESGTDNGEHTTIMFRDDDASHTQVRGVADVLLYLDRYYQLDKDAQRSRACTATSYELLRLGADIQGAFSSAEHDKLSSLLACLEEQLATHGGPFIAGRRFSIADCFVWPVLNQVVDKWDQWDADLYRGLMGYYVTTFKKKACVKRVRDKVAEGKKKIETDLKTVE